MKNQFRRRLKNLRTKINRKQIKAVVKCCFYAVAILAILFLPLLLNVTIISNNYTSKASNDAWLGFFGSYVGCIVGGFITMLVLFRTLNQQQQLHDENTRLATRPYFTIRSIEPQTVPYGIRLYFGQSDEHSQNSLLVAYFILENIGQGVAANWLIDHRKTTIRLYDHKGVISSTGIHYITERPLNILDPRAPLSPEIHFLKANSSLPLMLTVFSDTSIVGTLNIVFSYCDCLDREYSQTILLDIDSDMKAVCISCINKPTPVN